MDDTLTVKWPSWWSGKCMNKYSVATNCIMESPKNSILWLWPLKHEIKGRKEEIRQRREQHYLALESWVFLKRQNNTLVIVSYSLRQCSVFVFTKYGCSWESEGEASDKTYLMSPSKCYDYACNCRISVMPLCTKCHFSGCCKSHYCRVRQNNAFRLSEIIRGKPL